MRKRYAHLSVGFYVNLDGTVSPAGIRTRWRFTTVFDPAQHQSPRPLDEPTAGWFVLTLETTVEITRRDWLGRRRTTHRVVYQHPWYRVFEPALELIEDGRDLFLGFDHPDARAILGGFAAREAALYRRIAEEAVRQWTALRQYAGSPAAEELRKWVERWRRRERALEGDGFRGDIPAAQAFLDHLASIQPTAQ